MMTAIVMVLMILLFLGIVRVGLRLAWGVTKFIFGLALFWGCPLLFILVVLLGGFHYSWLPIVLIGLFCGRRFVRL